MPIKCHVECIGRTTTKETIDTVIAGTVFAVALSLAQGHVCLSSALKVPGQADPFIYPN